MTTVLNLSWGIIIVAAIFLASDDSAFLAICLNILASGGRL